MKFVVVALVAGTLLLGPGGTAIASSASTHEAPRAPRPVIERLHIGSATIGGVSAATISLGGIIYNHGTPAHWRFEWGLTRSYGHIAKRIGGERIGSRQYAEAEFPVKLNTTYYFRLVAFNSAGEAISRGLRWKTG
jgi:hypothetical protein